MLVYYSVYVHEKNQSIKSPCIEHEGWNCQQITRKGSYHIHSKLLVLVSKAWQYLIIINFCYPKMASKLAYSRLVSWIVGWHQKGGLILGGKILYCLGFKCKSNLIWFLFFYFKALNISQPSPNLWHYVVLNSLTKQLTKPNKPRIRHNLLLSFDFWLL